MTLACLIGAAMLVESDAAAGVHELVVGATGWLVWLGAGPLALSIAGGRDRQDRADGVELLAAIRGFRHAELEQARFVAALLQVTLRVAVPAAAMCLLVASFAWSSSITLVVQAALICLFAIVCGAAIGTTAVLCNRYGGARGRGLLLAVVLLPWAVFAQLGHAEWSLPGALGLALEAVSDVSWVVGAAP